MLVASLAAGGVRRQKGASSDTMQSHAENPGKTEETWGLTEEIRLCRFPPSSSTSTHKRKADQAQWKKHILLQHAETSPALHFPRKHRILASCSGGLKMIKKNKIKIKKKQNKHSIAPQREPSRSSPPVSSLLCQLRSPCKFSPAAADAPPSPLPAVGSGRRRTPQRSESPRHGSARQPGHPPRGV